MNPMPKSKSVWMQMVARCTKPRHKRYPYYGERGIKVCDRWLDYENFRADMGEPPKGLWLDRIDNDGNYEPTNCRWATPLEQSRNRRSTKMVEWNGKRLPFAQACEEAGLPIEIVSGRMRGRYWTLEKALSTPVGAIRPGKKVQPIASIPEKPETFFKMCKDAGLKPRTVRQRIEVQKMTLEKALSTPVGAIKRGRKSQPMPPPSPPKPKTFSQICRDAGIEPSIVRARMHTRNWTLEKALSTPLGAIKRGRKRAVE